MKRIKCAAMLLLAALMAAFLASAASAAKYTDVTDPETALAVSVLDALDVVEGFPDGGFHPEDTLTRAQFCKLAVLLLDLDDGLASASKKALFYDVTYSHWALSYVNLAYENGFIRGYGAGLFGPDDNVTYAQVLTVFLRILGYSDGEIGSVYPDDTMRMAEKLELCKGVERLPFEAVSRGETARLLLNLVNTENKLGIKIYSVLAEKTVENAVLVDTDCVSSSGKENCAKLYVNSVPVYYEKGADIPEFALGQKGAALLNKDDEIIAIVPGDTRYVTVDGVLLSSNDRASDDRSEMPYEVSIYTDGKRHTYPRSGTVSANLIGVAGTLLVDEKGYASAFVSADAEVYTVVKDTILLDEDSTSPSGKTRCAKLYVNGQPVWYEKERDIAASSVGFEGTALVNQDGELFAFAVGDTRYTAVSGVLLSNSERAEKQSELTHNVVIYTDGKRMEYPRAESITANLIGVYGTLLLNEKGYAEAFLSDDSDVYTVVDGAVLLDCNNGNGKAGFYVSGGRIDYRVSADVQIDSSDIGSSGCILLDDDNELFGYVPKNEKFSVRYGILTDADSDEASFLVDGDEEEYALSASLSANLIGMSGRMLINEYGEVEAFITDTDGGVVRDAVLLDNDCTSDEGTRKCALLLVNGKKVWYERAAKISASLIGNVGTAVLDEDDMIVEFIPGDDEYYVDYGHLVAISGNTAAFYLEHGIEELRVSGSVSASCVGLYGVLLMDGRDRVINFIPDEFEEGMALGQSGILIYANETAPDGRTKTAGLYFDGRINTVKVGERLDPDAVGLCGRILLDEDGSAVDFVEDDTNVTVIRFVSADGSKLVSDKGEYTVSDTVPVINDGELTVWKDIRGSLSDGDEISVYFNEIGRIDVLIIWHD